MSELLSNPWAIAIIGGVISTLGAAIITNIIQARRKPSLQKLYKQALQSTAKDLHLSHDDTAILQKALAAPPVVDAIKSEAYGPEVEARRLGEAIADQAPRSSALFDARRATEVVRHLLDSEYKLEGKYESYHSRLDFRRPFFAPQQPKVSPEPAAVKSAAQPTTPVTQDSVLPGTFFASMKYIEGKAEQCVDRKQSIEKLRSYLVNTKNRLMIIEGFGGIGKTTIAARFAIDISHSFTILWVDCQGIPITAERLLLELARIASSHYNYPWLTAIVENASLSDAEKATGLIEFLGKATTSNAGGANPVAQQPIALFFDDYHLIKDSALTGLIDKIIESQVDVKIVLVTRSIPPNLQYSIDNDNTLPVEGLSLADCRILLSSYTKRYPALAQVDEETLFRIWTRTGRGVPHALKLLISMTRTRPLVDVLQQLPDYDPFTAASRQWLASLFAELSPEEQRVAREISIFRRHTSHSALRYVSQCSDDLIDRLVDRFVLTFKDEQYFMHALWADYTRSLLTTADEKKTLHTRAAVFYREHAPNDRYERIMGLLESCHHFIAAGDLEQAEAVLVTIAGTLRSWGVFQELFGIFSEFELSATQQGKSLPPRLRMEQSAILYIQGKVEQAITILEELIITNVGEVGIKAHLELGWIYIFIGKRREAERLFLESLAQARQHNFPMLEAEALDKLQHIAYHESDFSKTLDYNEQRLKLLRQLPQDPEVREAIAWTYHEIGNVRREQGRYDEALKLYEQEVTLWHALGDPPYNVGWLTYDIGQIYRDLGRYKEALQKFEEAYQLFNRGGFVYGLAHVMIEQGRVGSRFDQTSAPIQKVEEAIVIFNQIKAPSGEAYALGALAEIYVSRALPDPTQALHYAQLSLDQETALKNTKGMAKSLHTMSLAYEEQGKQLLRSGKRAVACTQFEKALESITHAQELFDQMQTIPNFNGIADNAQRIRHECDVCKSEQT